MSEENKFNIQVLTNDINNVYQKEKGLFPANTASLTPARDYISDKLIILLLIILIFLKTPFSTIQDNKKASNLVLSVVLSPGHRQYFQIRWGKSSLCPTGFRF